jgi:hypothetical protein
MVAPQLMIEIARERHADLLREAEQERIANLLPSARTRKIRPWRVPTSPLLLVRRREGC